MPMNDSPNSPPPIGAAPEDHDYSHPWIISAIVSSICFVIGFIFLSTTKIWANFCQWADWPFLFYTAILTPVLMGFYAYGVYRLVAMLFARKRK
jgi:hypothetical protein